MHSRNNQRRFTSARAKRGVSGKFKILSKEFLILTGSIAGILLYILIVNVVTLKQYKVEELSYDLRQLRNDNEVLLVDAAELRSLQRVKEGISLSEYIPIDELTYLEVESTAFAQK